MINQDDLKRERTLLYSCLLSGWAPITTGYAALIGGSVLVFGDFLRRSSELLSLIFAWYVVRLINRKLLTTETQIITMERRSGLIVSIVLFISSIIIGVSSVYRLLNPQQTGNITLALLIAAAGFLVNFAFFVRYRNLNKVTPGPILTSQCYLYRSKTIIDLAIVFTLILSKVLPPHLAIYSDPVGSIGITILLLISAYRSLIGSVLNVDLQKDS